MHRKFEYYAVISWYQDYSKAFDDVSVIQFLMQLSFLCQAIYIGVMYILNFHFLVCNQSEIGMLCFVDYTIPSFPDDTQNQNFAVCCSWSKKNSPGYEILQSFETIANNQNNQSLIKRSLYFSIRLLSNYCLLLRLDRWKSRRKCVILRDSVSTMTVWWAMPVVPKLFRQRTKPNFSTISWRAMSSEISPPVAFLVRDCVLL